MKLKSGTSTDFSHLMDYSHLPIFHIYHSVFVYFLHVFSFSVLSFNKAELF